MMSEGSEDEPFPASSDSAVTPIDMKLMHKTCMSTESPNVRKNGFQWPFSIDQMAAIFGHMFSAICFYAAILNFIVHYKQYRLEAMRLTTTNSTEFEGRIGLEMMLPVPELDLRYLWLVLILHMCNMLLLACAWVSCERIDPAQESSETLPNGWMGIKLHGLRWEKTRYCSICKKSVPGLDHHCTWLQTCIGKANYAQFFAIACCGLGQFLLQALSGSYCLYFIQYRSLSLPTIGMLAEALLIICTALSIPCAVMYSVLWVFHVYLYCKGYGTYEWMLRRRKSNSKFRISKSCRKSTQSVPETIIPIQDRASI